MESSSSDGGQAIEIGGLPSFAHRPPVEPRTESAPLESGPLESGPHFHALSRPASALTGDFYLRLRRGDAWLFGLGDVAGHGLEAAVYMMMIQEEIERLADREDLRLPALVGELHTTMRRELPGSRFASLVLAEVDSGGRMEVVNAGHCPPLLRRAGGGIAGGGIASGAIAGGEIFALPPNGPILGPLPRSRWSSLHTRLRPDDTLLLVSDGVLEAPAPNGSEFGAERLWAALARDGGLPVETLAVGLMAEVTRFRGGAPPLDDTTIHVVRG